MSPREAQDRPRARRPRRALAIAAGLTVASCAQRFDELLPPDRAEDGSIAIADAQADTTGFDASRGGKDGAAPDGSQAVADASLDAAQQRVLPVLVCVATNADGSLTAFFDYRNPNAFDVSIPVGPDNAFAPSPQDRGQPVLFAGQATGHTRPAFAVPLSPDVVLVWQLEGSTASAAATSSPCPAGYPDAG